MKTKTIKRNRRTRDVRMWTWIFKSTKTGQYKVAGTMFEDRNRVLELGVKPKRVVVKGVPVRK